jgi:uncharacterized protein YkwD
MRKRCASLAIFASLASALFTLAAQPASALSSVENCFSSAINRERAAVGRPKLTLASDLVAIARRHSNWMKEDGTIYHADSSSPHYREGDNLSAELRGDWYAGGENVGMGGDCKSIHDAFMASKGHRENILDRDYNQVGVGVAVDGDTIYVTEDFIGRRTHAVRHVVRRATAPVHRVPRPKPRPLPQAPVTVEVMLRLIGLDASRVDAATGEAIGV